MKASVNVPLEVNLTTDMLLENCEYKGVVIEEIDKRVNKMVSHYFATAFSDSATFSRTERDFRWIVRKDFESAISNEVKNFMQDKKEEIFDTAVKTIADRIVRSSNNKTEMAEMLLAVLTMK